MRRLVFHRQCTSHHPRRRLSCKDYNVQWGQQDEVYRFFARVAVYFGNTRPMFRRYMYIQDKRTNLKRQQAATERQYLPRCTKPHTFGSLPPLLSIRGVSKQHVGPKAGCSEGGLSWIFSVPPGKFSTSSSNIATAASFRIPSNSNY